MSDPTRVLVTGGFGNVGAHVVRSAAAAGHDVTVIDLRTDATTAKAKALRAEGVPFTAHAVDLTDPLAVAEVVAAVAPGVIIHTAAVIAPTAFTMPERARAVNVDGTANLLAAAKASGRNPRFVFLSSYTVVGPRNPHRNLDPITGDTPSDPADTYARHKAEGEAMVAASGLPWTVLRLPAVGSLDEGWGRGDEFLRFMFLIPLDQREHGCDARDVGRAVANAATADVEGRILAIGGTDDWRTTAREHRAAALAAQGLPMPDVRAFRRAHADADHAWYAEDVVDTTEAQHLLDFQRISWADHLDAISAGPVTRTLMRAMGPAVAGTLARRSPFRDQPIDAESLWTRVADTFGIPHDTR
ncbi:MAG: NAD(P)-dependent oxidoreductase [Acidimicrobiia bacterium]